MGMPTLKIEALHIVSNVQHGKYSITLLFFNSNHKRTSLLFDDYFKLNSSMNTRSHELTIQPVISTINSFRYSFFVNSVFLWNSVPISILSIVSKYIFRCKLRSFLS